jgi:SAM-dependent methyltransferase
LSPLEAELYALTHRGNPGDVPFYANACVGAGSVLELGVGYGRLLPALSRVARRVIGLDREPRLLAVAQRSLLSLPRAQQRRVTLVRGDMQGFELGQQFERILLPYNGLYCLRSRRALLACLRSVRAHLAPGGEFLFDVWAADRFHRESDSRAYRDDELPILNICRGKQSWDVFETSRLRKGLQRLDVLYRYVPRVGRAQISIGIEQRYLLFSELLELLARAGLEARSTFGGFAGQRFSTRSEELVVRAQALPSRHTTAARSVGTRFQGVVRRNRVQETSVSQARATKGHDKRRQSG